jgi:D-sedoheptulose 7-phosphate isomerase
LHFAINDMQIAEDLQLIIGHMIMQWLCSGANSGK